MGIFDLPKITSKGFWEIIPRVVSERNYLNKLQYRTKKVKNELWGPKNVNKSINRSVSGIQERALSEPTGEKG